MLTEVQIKFRLKVIKEIIAHCYNENLNNWCQETLNKCKKYKIDLNEPDSYNRTILFYTVLNGDADFIKYLIALGANINGTDHDGKGVLYHGMSKNLYVFKELLKYGADIDRFLKQVDFCILSLQEKHLIHIASIADAISNNTMIDIKVLVGPLNSETALKSVYNYEDNLELIKIRLKYIKPINHLSEIKLNLYVPSDMVKNEKGCKDEKSENKIVKDLNEITNAIFRKNEKHDHDSLCEHNPLNHQKTYTLNTASIAKFSEKFKTLKDKDQKN